MHRAMDTHHGAHTKAASWAVTTAVDSVARMVASMAGEKGRRSVVCALGYIVGCTEGFVWKAVILDLQTAATTTH